MRQIPPMTHEYGKYWEQPKREDILLDDDCAVMTAETLNKLPQYDVTNPTGAYEGKMWRRVKSNGQFMLCWYGFSDDPKMVSINATPIYLLDPESLTQ